MKQISLSITLITLLMWLTTSIHAAPPPQEEVAEWTVMLYQVADDNQLEQDILIDFNEAETVGSSESVNVVAQVDRFDGSFDGMGDWTGAKRYYVTANGSLDEIGSEELEDLGEVNMADGDTLVDFISWSVETFPAEKYALIMSDHGIGWVGGFGDPAPGGPGAHDVFLLNFFEHDMLWLMEIDDALGKARQETGIDKFDLVTLDVCLMGQIEVANALAPHAKYIVASEEVVPGVGMAYAHFLSDLQNNPSMDGEDLAISTVTGFLDEDMRLSDPDFAGPLTPAQVAQELFYGSTLTAIDSEGVPELNLALDEFVVALNGVDPNVIAEARAYAQSYESPFGEEFPSPFIDLGHFAQLTAELSQSAEVQTAATNLMSALEQAVVAERHGPGKPGSTGLAVHLPVKELYDIADNLGYNTIASRFVENTQWDEFLGLISGAGTQPFVRPKPEPAPATASTEPEPDETEVDLPATIDEAEYSDALEALAFYEEEGYAAEEIALIMAEEEAFSSELLAYLESTGQLAGSSSTAQASTPSESKPLQISPLNLSSEVSMITQPVTIQTEVTGNGLAYVYQFIGRYLPREDILIYEDIDYIVSDEDKTVGGVTYPEWGESPVDITFDWEPIVYAISDGENSVRALFEPDTYGEAPTYVVQGAYNFQDGSPSRYTKMYFRDTDDDGIIEMTDVFGYAGQSITNSVGAPREIYPEAGDSFTVLYTGEDYREGAEEESYRQLGETITFTTETLVLEETPAPSGNYVVGIIVEDINGNTSEEYAQLFVYNPDAAAIDGFAPYINDDIGFAMLYPEDWLIEYDEEAEGVFITSEDLPAYAFITSGTIDGATTPDEASQIAIEQITAGLAEDGDFENMQFTEPATTVLGTFNAVSVEFVYEIDGESFYGEAIAATPVETYTYVMLISGEETQYDELLADYLDPMVISFDTFVYGQTAYANTPPPEMAEELFYDDFSDPESGLFDLEDFEEWGIGYYSPDEGLYVYDLAPEGFYYDYYYDAVLEDSFMIQVTAHYTGAIDNGYGLIFQVLPGDEYDQLYSFRISGDGFYMVEKMGESYEELIEWTASDMIDQTEGADNLLTVVGADGTYDFYINGAYVNSITDVELSGGTFGFVAENYDDTALAAFKFSELIVGTIE